MAKSKGKPDAGITHRFNALKSFLIGIDLTGKNSKDMTVFLNQI